MLKWKLYPVQEALVSLLKEKLNLPPVIANLLTQRGIQTPEDAQYFLKPALMHLLPPDHLPHEDLPDLSKGAERILRAILKKERILIYGDYDVDGVSGATLLYLVLKELGAEVEAYLSDRFTEGYGLNLERLRWAKHEQFRVVISVDMGCTAIPQAEFCLESGIDLIITDHHTLPESVLPQAFALIHPLLEYSCYRNKFICGAGVAYKLALAVARAVEGSRKLSPSRRDLMLDMLGLASLGTIADVVSLQGENRAIVQCGLKYLKACRLAGIQALLQITQTQEKLSAVQVSWRIAPLINSAGRMGCALDAFNLLRTNSIQEASEFSQKLYKTNENRKKIQEEVLKNALQQVKEQYPQASSSHSLVLAGEGWHEGVIGIVAARVASIYYKPTIVLSILENRIAKGSGRSIEGVSLLAGLQECRELLTTFGGHPAAVGLSLSEQNLSTFRKRFDQAIAQQMREESNLRKAQKKIDSLLTFEEINDVFLNFLEKMEPFGQGNPEPYFLCTSVQLLTPPQLMGKEKNHIQCVLHQMGRSFRCVGFDKKNRFEELEELALSQQPFSLICRPLYNHFNGKRTMELHFYDFAVSLEKFLEDPLPLEVQEEKDAEEAGEEVSSLF
jgi:single-stranded-DNA-specific exonuclease